MTQPIRLSILLEALIHQVELIVQAFVRAGMPIGLFAVFIVAMPVVIALNLLTKLLSADAVDDW